MQYNTEVKSEHVIGYSVLNTLFGLFYSSCLYPLKLHRMLKTSYGVTLDPSTGVPDLVFISVDKTGKGLVEHPSGTHGAATKEPMTLDTVFLPLAPNL